MSLNDFPLTAAEQEVVDSWLEKGPWQVSKDSGLFSRGITMFRMEPYQQDQFRSLTFAEVQIIAARRNQLLSRSEA